MRDWIECLPKAELHLHIEGTFEPELVFEIARRNRVFLPFESVESLRSAYRFANLQEFLDIYYESMKVLQTERDFFELTGAYLDRAARDGVAHVEVSFDPQGHTARGVPFDVVAVGIFAALEDAETRHGITHRLIMSFLRHLSEEDGFQTLARAARWIERIAAVGLDSSEMGHPPMKFARLFRRCREMGLLLSCHAGEEGPPEYVRQALEIGVDRIDHGNRAMEDAELVAELVRRRMPLTVCPLSNLALRVVDRMEESPVERMLDAGLVVTVNSDDPAYFGGYMNDNLLAVTGALDLAREDLAQLVENSFAASFLSDADKAAWRSRVEAAAR